MAGRVVNTMSGAIGVAVLAAFLGVIYIQLPSPISHPIVPGQLMLARTLVVAQSYLLQGFVVQWRSSQLSVRRIYNKIDHLKDAVSACVSPRDPVYHLLVEDNYVQYTIVDNNNSRSSFHNTSSVLVVHIQAEAYPSETMRIEYPIVLTVVYMFTCFVEYIGNSGAVCIPTAIFCSLRRRRE